MGRRCIVFGGSFDPPTLAHAAIIRACLQLDGFDAVWVMPSAARRDKAMAAPAAARWDMVSLLKRAVFHDDRRLTVSDFELRLPAPGVTYRTVQALRRRYPDTEFWFVFGSDVLAGMDRWEHGAELRVTLPSLIVPRGSVRPAVLQRNQRILRVAVPAGCSSTAVRARLCSGRPAADLVPPAVAQYIDRHALYRPAAAA